MQINNNFKNTESLKSFQEWWEKRIAFTDDKIRPPMPDFFEVWNARQPTIDELRRENEQLKDKIKSLEAGK